MESKSNVTYHDQNESRYMQNTVDINTDYVLSTDLTRVNGVVSHFPPPLMLPPTQTQVNEIAYAMDPLSGGPTMQVAVNFGNYGRPGGSVQAVPSSNHNHMYQQLGSQYFADQDVVTMAVWQQPSLPFNCSCCQLLKEIFHTNGTAVIKLELHGRLGMCFHGIMFQQNANAVSSGNYQHRQIFDFSRNTMEEVKQFVIEYCLGKNLAGYAMLPDRSNYETMSFGFDWNEEIAEGFDLECSLSSEENSVGDQTGSEAVSSSTRPSLSAQRKRSRKLTLQELSNYFHLPIEAAAKQVNLCPTVVKKVCRQHGLLRWPYRKMKSIENKMPLLRNSLESGDAGTRGRARAEIRRLRQEVTQHCAGILPSAINFDC